MNKGQVLGLVFLILTCKSFSQSVGIGTNSPDASSQLDITSKAKGLLIPRMSTSSINAIPNPAKGLLVYDSIKNQIMINTGTAAAPIWQVTAPGVSWSLGGNNGINPSSQFIGNIDNQPLRFRVNNIQAGELSATGNISWGLRAGLSSATGFSNIAIGTDALRSNVAIGNLVAVGDSALFNNQGDPVNEDASFNTAVGSKSMYSNTIGSKNTAIGFNSLFSNVNGSFNTASGYQSLFANTTGTSNTASGFNSLFSNTIGSSNTAYGNLSLFTNISGSSNTGIGDQALVTNTTGNNNTAVGEQSLGSNTTGSSNTASGMNALFSNTSGHDNTAMGFGSLMKNTTGIDNTALGSQALFSNNGPSGNENTAIGMQALSANTSGSLNTAGGSESLLSNIGGTSNTALGVASLQKNTFGQGNTAVGVFALASNTLGTNNTAIGINAMGIAANAGSNNTAIGSLAGSSSNIGSTNTFLGAQSGTNGAFNNSTALGALSTITKDNQVMIGSSGTTSINGFVNFSVISDGRFKKDITEDVKGLSFIMKLRPVNYRLDVSGISARLNESRNKELDAVAKKAIAAKEQNKLTGFIAQEVEKAATDAGYDFSGVDKPKNDNELYALRYAEFVVPLVKAIQEQQKLIEELQKQNEASKLAIEELRNQLKESKAKK